MNSKPVSVFKRELMMKIASNEKIFELIDNKKAEYPDDLLGNKLIGCPASIFPRIDIGFTVLDAGTYIGLKVDFPSISKNDAYKNCLITIMIISHNGHIDYPLGGCRTDLIAEEIIKMFNFNHDYPFEMMLQSDIEDVFNEKFYFRRLTFKTLEHNSAENQFRLEQL